MWLFSFFDSPSAITLAFRIIFINLSLGSLFLWFATLRMSQWSVRNDRNSLIQISIHVRGAGGYPSMHWSECLWVFFLKCHRKTFHNVVANNVVLISMYRIECVLLGNATFCLALKNCEQPAIVYEWTLCKYKSTPIKSLFHIFALTLIIWVNKQHSYQPVIPSSGLHRPNTKWLRWLCCVKLKPPQISSPKLQTLIYFFNYPWWNITMLMSLV